MRNMSPGALAAAQSHYGVSPVMVVEVDWVPNTHSAYADKHIPGHAHGRILDIGNLDSVVGVTQNESSQELTITLDDTDGTIKGIIDQHDPHKKDVRIIQWFEGTDYVNDRFLIFRGKINSPVVWSESQRTVRFQVVTQLEDWEIGFSAEEGQFPHIPNDLIGKAWPMVFGTVLDSPTVRINKAVSGTTLDGVGIISGVAQHTAMARLRAQQGMSDFEGQNSRMRANVGMQNAQITFISSCAVDYDLAGDLRGVPEWNQKAQELYQQVEDMRANNSQSLGRASGQRGCETRNQNSQIDANLEEMRRGQGPDVIRVLGGEDFPQGTAVVVNIGGGLFTGTFHGQNFHIASRYHPDHEQEAQDKANNSFWGAAGSTENCNQGSGNGGRLEMEVPDLGGEMWTKTAFVFQNNAAPPRFTRSVNPPGGAVARQFWAEAGARVVLHSDEPTYYIVSIIPGTVLQVRAWKTTNFERSLVNVPNDLWRVENVNYGPVQTVQVVVNKPLSTITDAGWEDDLYVTFESSVGPNGADILQFIVENYTTLEVDPLSFGHVRTRLEPFPMGFPVLERRNALEALRDYAFQARCALWISNGIVKLQYLPEIPSPVSDIYPADIDALPGVSMTLTDTEALVTKLVANWRVSWAEDEQRLILRANIDKYGTQEEEFSFHCYNRPDIVMKVATFWLIRKSNTWKRLLFSTSLSQLAVEPFDAVDIQLPGLASNSATRGVVEKASYNSATNTIDFECWTPVRSGEMEPYIFAFPADLSPSLTYPAEGDQAGGAGLGPQAVGNLPVGYVGNASGQVFVGGPNIIFGPQTDIGDRTPTDVGFVSQDIILPGSFQDLNVTPRPFVNLSLPDAYTFKADYLDDIIPNPMPSGSSSPVIDIRSTRVIDSDAGNESTRLDTIFSKIATGRLVIDGDGALIGNSEMPDGVVFDFEYDADTGQMGAGTAFLQDD